MVSEHHKHLAPARGDWECIIARESCAAPPNSNPVFEFPVRIAATGQVVGRGWRADDTAVNKARPCFQHNMPPGCKEDLVSLTGLLPLTDWVSSRPGLTRCSRTLTSCNAAPQMATMGYLLRIQTWKRNLHSGALILRCWKRGLRKCAAPTSSTEGKLPCSSRPVSEAISSVCESNGSLALPALDSTPYRIT
jgi:hypothetical protein